MTVKIDSTARIEKIRVQPQGTFPAGDPESGYGWLYFVTGTANGGMYFENDAGMRIGPFITGSSSSNNELDYVQFTGTVSVSSNAEGANTLIVTSSSIVYDGSTPVLIEFFAPYIQIAGTDNIVIVLYDDTAATSIGKMAQFTNPDQTVGNVMRTSCHTVCRITPAAGARVYKITAFRVTNNGAVGVGGGGIGSLMPGYIRITRAT